MKTFIFNQIESKQQRTGGQKVTVNVYQIVKNVPQFICEVTWNTAAYKGATSCIMNKLAELKKVPYRFVNKYYNLNDKFQIISL